MEVKRLPTVAGRWLHEQWEWLATITIGVVAAAIGFVVAPIPLWLVVVGVVIGLAASVAARMAIAAGNYAVAWLAALSMLAIVMMVLGSAVGEDIR